MIAFARRKKVPCLVDPKGNDFGRYRGATLITPNLAEFEAIVGSCEDEKELIGRAHKLVDEVELEGLLVTRSEKGMLLVTKESEQESLPTRAQEVFDVTGAGDTVISVLAAGMAVGLDMVDAMKLANLAAGIVVGKLGTATVTQEELANAQIADQDYSHKIVPHDRLLELIQLARHKGERVVFTNGCFDVLHAGHVHYLERAKKLGTRLIVAVNSDDSVKRLKGKERPINTLDDRMAVLSALGFVDWVVSFDEDTPEQLINRVVPDVLVKGGDYRPKDIVGYNTVTKNGGEVIVLDFLPGRSTSGLIKTIRDQV
jgi:D-beta-D-heptose 7-phosphate kinase/D-beta-D-heptose 1-phosphate adenosyltransferase